MKMRVNSKSLKFDFKTKIREILIKQNQVLASQKQTIPKFHKKSQTEFNQSCSPKNNNTSSSDVTFQQYLQILSNNNIRLYSKNQLNKLKKLFINCAHTSISFPISQSPKNMTNHGSFKRQIHMCPLGVLLDNLELICLQQSIYQNFFIVKISDEYTNAGKPYQSQPYSKFDESKDDHDPEKECLNTLVRVMRSKYGNYTNWFKVLGGKTICMSIEKNIFGHNLRKILSMSRCGENCVTGLINLFSQDQDKSADLAKPTKDIKWLNFVRIINSDTIEANNKMRLKTISNFSMVDQFKNGYYFNPTSWTQNTYVSQKQAQVNKKSKQESIRLKRTNSSKNQQRKKQSESCLLSHSKRPSTIHQEGLQERSNAFSQCHDLFIQPKSCKLNTRKASLIPDKRLFSVKNGSRQIKTTSNFFRSRKNFSSSIKRVQTLNSTQINLKKSYANDKKNKLLIKRQIQVEEFMSN